MKTVRVKPSRDPEVEAMRADPEKYFREVRERAWGKQEHTAADEVQEEQPHRRTGWILRLLQCR